LSDALDPRIKADFRRLHLGLPIDRQPHLIVAGQGHWAAIALGPENHPLELGVAGGVHVPVEAGFHGRLQPMHPVIR